jgi:hypothetical protein
MLACHSFEGVNSPLMCPSHYAHLYGLSRVTVLWEVELCRLSPWKNHITARNFRDDARSTQTDRLVKILKKNIAADGKSFLTSRDNSWCIKWVILTHNGEVSLSALTSHITQRMWN